MNGALSIIYLVFLCFSSACLLNPLGELPVRASQEGLQGGADPSGGHNMSPDQAGGAKQPPRLSWSIDQEYKITIKYIKIPK